MPAPVAAAAGAAASVAAGASRMMAAGRAAQAGIQAFLKLDVVVGGQERIGQLYGMFSSFQAKLQNLGITIIFVDRAIMAMKRGWDTFNEAIGASRVSQLALDFSRHADYYEMSVESFQALVLMAVHFGASVSDVTDMLSTMQQRIAEIGESKSLTDALKGTGLTKKSFEGLGTMERLFKIQEAISKLPAAARARAMGMFGGDDLSRKFGPMGGIDAMLSHMKEMMALGAVMTDSQVTKAKAFARQNERLSATLTGLGNNVAAIFIPALTRLGKAFEWLFGGISRYVQNNSEKWGKSLERAMDKILLIMTKIGDSISRFMPLDQFVKQLTDGVIVAGLLYTTWASLTLLFKGAALLKTLFYAALWAESFFVWLRGGKSVIGDMLQQSPALHNMMLAFGVLKVGVMTLVTAAAEMGQFLMKSELVRDILAVIIALLGAMFEITGDVFRTFVALLGILDRMWVVLKAIVSLGYELTGSGIFVRMLTGSSDVEAAKASSSAIGKDFAAIFRAFNPFSDAYREPALGSSAYYAFNAKPGTTPQTNNVTNHFTINAQGVDPQATMQSALEQSAAMARGTIPGKAP